MKVLMFTILGFHVGFSFLMFRKIVKGIMQKVSEVEKHDNFEVKTVIDCVNNFNINRNTQSLNNVCFPYSFPISVGAPNLFRMRLLGFLIQSCLKPLDAPRL